MVGKTYLRYVVGPQGGSVVSRASLTIDATLGRPQYETARVSGRGQSSSSSRTAVQRGAMLFLPSLEAVRVFSVKSGTLLHTLIPAEVKMPLEVTALRVFPLEPQSQPYHTATTNDAENSNVVASSSAQDKGWLLLAGYSNGFVAVFTCGPGNNYGAPLCRFYAMGHRTDTAVLALDVDAARAMACSAGQDTDVTLWDMMSHEAAFRLRGHRGGVVGLQFVPGNDTRLVSTAADGLVKVWDVTLRQCIQTLVASDTQVTAMVMDAGGRRLYCGMRENYIKVYNVEGLAQQTQASSSNNKYMNSVTEENNDNSSSQAGLMVEHGTLARKYHKPITALRFSPDGGFLVACTSKTVEVFHVLTASEVRRKVMRKRRRRRATDSKKSENNNNEEDDDEVEEGEGRKAARRKPRTSRERGDDGSGEAAMTEQEQHEEGGDNRKEEALPTTNTTTTTVSATAAEEVVLLRTFFLDDKVRAACVLPRPRAAGAGLLGGGEGVTSNEVLLAVSFANNTVRTYSTALTLSERDGAATWSLTDLQLRYSFDEQGHQSDIRRLCFVDQDSMLLSMSAEKVMLWSLAVAQEMLDCDHANPSDFYDAREANLVRPEFKGTLHAIGTVPVSEATCMAAISSGLCCIGQANGSVVLLDVASAQTLYSDPGVHMGGVKDVIVRNDKSGFLSLGADRRLLLWTIGLTVDEDKAQTSKSATLLQSHEVELAETPLFASFSPDNRLLGVGLHSHTIQLFFADTLKPYLSLFGHKLPPTAMDFSSDGSLAVSVGMDKSLRFWGTDFGDCHRAIHAHDDYITDVHFQRDTHYVFTVSLDGALKQWDGDNWTMVQLFRQHSHGLWGLAITANGTCLATAGLDRCIRCFLRTSDIVFPQEEEERMAQEAMDEESARRVAQQRLDAVAVDSAAEVGVAAQPTAATAEAAERLMEALDLVSVELQRRQNPDDPNRHPLLLRCTEWEYLWSVIESIRPSELRHALGALTSVHVDALLNYLVEMLQAGAVLNYEIAAKVVLALFVPSAGSTAAGAGGGAGGYALHASLAALSGAESETQGLRRLERLRRGIAEGLDRVMSKMDYSVAGLQVVRQYLQDTEHVKFFDLSSIQGYKKRYHSRAILPSSSTTQDASARRE